jgi:hypothetical protein
MNRPAQPASAKSAEHLFSRFGTLLAAFALCAGAAAGQTASPPSPKPATQPARRIVVSIPDRKLALLEGDRIVKIERVQFGDRVSLVAKRTDEVARLFGPAPSPLAEAPVTLQAEDDSPGDLKNELRGQH